MEFVGVKKVNPDKQWWEILFISVNESFRSRSRSTFKILQREFYYSNLSSLLRPALPTCVPRAIRPG